MNRKRVVSLVVIGVFGASILAGAFAVAQVQRVARESETRLSELRRTLAEEVRRPSADAVGTSAAATASEAVVQVCQQSGQLDRDLGLLPELGGVAGSASEVAKLLPQVGNQAAGTLTVASAAAEAFAGLRTACEAFEPLVQAEAAGADVGGLVAVLGDVREQLRTAAGRLQAAHQQLVGIDEKRLDDSTARLAGALRDRLPSIEARLSLLAEVPGLLGYDGPKTYLILGQNSDELRPTGGFVGTSGLVTFEGGRLVERDYGSSFNLRVPPDLLVKPPEPLQRHMGAGYWHLHEANWWPDFPTAAQQSRYFFNIVRPERLAGVVAIDQEFVARLLGLTGPVEVPGYDEVVTRENLRERLEYQVHVIGKGDENERKGFVTALFANILPRVEALPKERFSDLVRVLDDALLAQHVLVWSADSRAQAALARVGWDGRMLAAEGDYLYPVSANVSGNKLGGFKINRWVDQEVDYAVRQGREGGLIGKATITLRNRAKPAADAQRPSTYRNYFRLYVPAGSELLSATGFEGAAESLQECGRSAFGGLVVVGPGERRSLELEYRLPARVGPEGYSLLIQKQPGAEASRLRVRAEGLSTGSIETKLVGPALFKTAAGELAPARWVPAQQPPSSDPACPLMLEPPTPLAAPRQLVIPRLELQSEVVDLGVDENGMLEAPTTGGVVGWYHQTARPGQVGNFIASGHVDWDKQPGVFWRLRETRPGDHVKVVDEEGVEHVYEVQWVKSYDAYQAPLFEILGPTTERWMTLITCGGTFNPATRDYSERLIVRASAVQP